MTPGATTAAAWLTALLSVAAPSYIAVRLSWQQALQAETDLVTSYAGRVLWRMDNVADQIVAATAHPDAARAGARCSPEDIRRLRELDFGASYTQTMGRIEGDRLLCTSLGTHGEGFALGEPDLVSATGVRAWHRASLFSQDAAFVVIEYRGYAAVVHRRLLIDLYTGGDDVLLAAFSDGPTRAPLAARGPVRAEWADRLAAGSEVSFVDGPYLVAVARSRKHPSPLGVAALPIGRTEALARQFALRFVPVGALSGLALALAVIHLSRRLVAMPTLMRAALRRDEFFLLYQPIVDLRSGRRIGAEALIRWRRPDGSVVRPELFIRAAEESGLILSITERVVELVARDAAQLFRGHPDFHIGINLSSADLESARTPGMLRRLAERSGAAPGNLLVEATERGFLKGEATRRVVADLRAAGLRVAIDDFGTGYSSLSYLESFAVDYLKIDKSFVDTIGTGAAPGQVIPHIIEMAKSLRLEMIAEGVETEAQAVYLRERGVRFGQGWLFGEPMPLSEIVARLPAA